MHLFLILFSATVCAGSANINLGTQTSVSENRIQRARSELSARLERHDSLNWSRRILLNERPRGSPEGILRTVGFVHLYTSSGMHIYGFLVFLEHLVKRLAVRTRNPAAIRRGLNGIGLLLLGWAWCLQDFRIGFFRPILAYFIRMWARHQGYRFRLLGVLAILIFVEIVAAFILKIKGTGFHASAHYFLAIGGGAVGLHVFSQSKKLTPFQEHLVLAICSWLTTAGFDLVRIQQVAPWTAVLSLITVPVLSAFLYPLLLLGTLLPSGILETISEFGNAGIEVLADLTDVAGGLVFVSFSAVLVGFAIAAVWVVVIKCYRKLLRMPVFFVMSVIVCFVPQLQQKLHLEQIDIGQGDSLLLQAEGRNELVDAGKESAKTDADWLVVFSKNKVTKLDALLISHWDEDHAGGFRQLERLIPLECVHVHKNAFRDQRGQDWLKWGIGRRNLNWRFDQCLEIGKIFSWESLKLQKNPSRKIAGNERMLGMEVELDPNLLFVSLGDGDKEMERVWYARHLDREIAKNVDGLKSKRIIWKVNHHGSNTSTSKDVLTKIQIQEFWISVGRKNFYGHPTENTMQTLNSVQAFRPDTSAFVRRTDLHGDLHWQKFPTIRPHPILEGFL